MIYTVIFPSEPDLEPVPGGVRLFKVLDEWTVTVNGAPITVPEGTLTDLASIPGLFENIIDNDDPRILRPSILHDYLYQNHGVVFPGASDGFTREQCDEILADGMASCGAGMVIRAAVFDAVRAGGQFAWDNYYPVSK